MFRPMRRKKREISLEDTKKLLSSERRGVFAVNGDDGYPYAVPVNFYYDEENEKIYFHGALAGHKADALKRDDKVCFTVYGNEQIKEEAWAPYMQSAVIFGRCKIISDDEKKIELLKKVAAKYYPDEPSIEEEIAKCGKAAQIYEITIEHMSGKEVQEK